MALVESSTSHRGTAGRTVVKRRQPPPGPSPGCTSADELSSILEVLKLRSAVAVVDCAPPLGSDLNRGGSATAQRALVVVVIDGTRAPDAQGAGQASAAGLADRLSFAAAAVAHGGAVVSWLPASAPAGKPASPPDRPSLTRRELEITQLIASGLSNRSIAAQLSISIRTVESHRGSLRRKLGVRSTATLVHWALQNRLLSVPAGG